jgi:hypothetical protein
MCTERISLTRKCGWKDGDRGGLAQTEETHREEEERKGRKKKKKKRLDTHRPHGRTW